jgi:hypothetical protein
MAVSNPMDAVGSHNFKEAVCIDTQRIYDSCSDKDCLEDLRVYFTDCGQQIIDNASTIKAKRAEILNVYLEVEPVPFNKGFYAVDMTYFFLIKFSAYTSPVAPPCIVCGLATFSKKVILYGSEGNVRVFSSDTCGNWEMGSNLPSASVQVVDPLVLACRVVDCSPCTPDPCTSPPPRVAERFEGSFLNVVPVRSVFVTLGLFSIVQIERNVQMMIPTYDFCVPDKECVTTTDDPCELFKRIKFPTDEFFPPRYNELLDE